MRTSGVGAPGSAANALVAISVWRVPPVGGSARKVKRPVSRPATSKNASCARAWVSPGCGPQLF